MSTLWAAGLIPGIAVWLGWEVGFSQHLPVVPDLTGKHSMSEEYLILFHERCPPEEMVGDPEHHLHCALLVGPPSARDVADAVCTALNRDVDFMRNAKPYFKVCEEDSPTIPLRAQFAVELRSYTGCRVLPNGDQHGRAVAIHEKALQLKDYVRSCLGTAAPTEQTPKHAEPDVPKGGQAAGCKGFVSADTLGHDHGIKRNRLAEAATSEKVSTMPAPPGLKDSQGHQIRKLYNLEEALAHFL